MAKDGGGEELLCLGVAQWDFLPGGRVRCVQTGHEMPLAAQSNYASTKKCRSALLDAALQKRTPPLNFFEQSPVAKDKIVCKLTGVVLNKKEDAVRKHMLGKKFEQKLAEKEAEKGFARKDVEMTENAEKLSSNNNMDLENLARDGDKETRKKKGKIVVDEQESGEANSDGSDFWVPPAGERWDFDNGSKDRWSDVSSHSDLDYSKSVQINGTKHAASEDGSNIDNADTEMFDAGEDYASNDDSEGKIRSRKKRAKRLKAGRT